MIPIHRQRLKKNKPLLYNDHMVTATLSLTDQFITARLIDRLIPLMPITKVIVFGSRARGSATAESDLDILIVVPQRTPQMMTLIDDIAWEVGLSSDVVISPLVLGEKELEQGWMSATPLARAIVMEGIQVWPKMQ